MELGYFKKMFSASPDSQYYFKTSSGTAYILDSLVEQQRDLIANINSCLEKPDSCYNVKQCLTACIPNKVSFCCSNLIKTGFEV